MPTNPLTCKFCGGYDSGGLIPHCSGCGRPLETNPADAQVPERPDYEFVELDAARNNVFRYAWLENLLARAKWLESQLALQAAEVAALKAKLTAAMDRIIELEGMVISDE